MARLWDVDQIFGRPLLLEGSISPPGSSLPACNVLDIDFSRSISAELIRVKIRSLFWVSESKCKASKEMKAKCSTPAS